MIMDKEEDVISSHRWHIDDMVELVKKVIWNNQEMAILSEVDK